jgi:hypothetical protein
MNELVMAIRRQSQGFTRGSSAFRGVTQHKTGAGPPGQGNVPFLHLCPARVPTLRCLAPGATAGRRAAGSPGCAALAATPVTHVRTALCPAQ